MESRHPFSLKRLILIALITCVAVIGFWYAYGRATAPVANMSLSENILYTYPSQIPLPANVTYPLGLKVPKEGNVEVHMKVDPADSSLEISVRGSDFKATTTGERRNLSFHAHPGTYVIEFKNGPQETRLLGNIILISTQ